MKKFMIASLLGSVAMTGSAFAQMAPASPATEGTVQTDGMTANPPAAADGTAVIVGETDANAMGNTANMGEGGFLTYQDGTQMLGSGLMDADVWGADGESIGSVSDLVLDNNGEVIAIVVGVGGFLGLGEKDVAITTDALEFVLADDLTTADGAVVGDNDVLEEPVDSTVAPTAGNTTAMGTTATAPAAGTTTAPMGTTGTAGTMGTTGLAAGTTDQRAMGTGWGWNGGGIEYIQVAYTRDQLEDAPEFEYID